MSYWTPDPQAVEQLQLILNGTVSGSQSIIAEATEALTQARQQPDFENYLLHILLSNNGTDSQIRASAGLTLKNSIMLKEFAEKPDSVKHYILNEILTGLMDSDSLVRNITGNVVTSLFSLFGVKGWPQVLVQLLDLASSEGQEKAQEGAINALAKICEDSSVDLDKSYNGETPSEFIVPRLLQLMNSPIPRVRAKSVTCINLFLLIKSSAIMSRLDEYMQKLFVLATDQDGSVRRSVCTAFVDILDADQIKLQPHLDGVINYCLHSVNDQDEEVALEACEFLLGLSTSLLDESLLVKKLPQIIPTLLSKMAYSELDIFLIENQDAKDDATEADRDEDIKPQMAKSKNSNRATSSKKERDTSQLEDNNDSEDDSDDDDGSDLSEWNLRKCAAATLDVLATNFPQEVLDIVFPIVRERIMSPEWPVVEASLLALGAIADGCIDLAKPQLPELIPFFVEKLKAPQPRVRQITCWTLGRYAQWVCTEAGSGGRYGAYFLPTFQAIMTCALDNKKVVQESACSSLANFVEATDQSMITPLVEPLLYHFQQCFKTYQRKNLIILYDAVQTFVEKAGEMIQANEGYISLLLPPLIEKWQQFNDDDQDLWPLLECMSTVAASLGESFAQYAVPVYERAINILQTCVEQDQRCQTSELITPPEKDFIVTSIDLIDGLVQGLTTHSAELIKQFNSNERNLMHLLLICFEDSFDDVRQSAFALLGDLSIFLLNDIVKPYLHQVMICIDNEIKHRNYNSNAVCNNATWALGEISMRLSKEEIMPYLPSFVSLLNPLLEASEMQSTVLENAAITIGRMGISSNEALAPYANDFINQWCKLMLYLEENEEKETSFIGMCRILSVDPRNLVISNRQAGLAGLTNFLRCVLYYESPSEELYRMFFTLLNGFSAYFGSEWNVIVSALDQQERDLLQARYNV
ncbi:hypothetical protein LJB42_000726 [Komagataella kurtzmanii]|nr:hypothetical protein LJB42_000726 [Komagataella kurtzmanii]